MTKYRLDRRFTLPAIGIHLIAAGLVAALAFWVWAPLGVLTVLLLLNALRVFAFPPAVVRADPSGVRLGGLMTMKPVRVVWTEVEDVTVDRTRLVFDRGDAGTTAFPLAYVGPRAEELVREVYDRLNTANGYTRYEDPSS
ncbi:hypothetical protein GEV29_03400 [Aeromicrobium sp. SMF47]|uniref:Uncharacterized protein n=1 Tax=Aeromicrobium yanjiei TaxID=2662028 RepID=A0A5Q2MJ84_9ACTN|nr:MULTISPECIES: hypothetical protein [Aeromicrobium]MRJ75571.1 hypothetical protein [Aeromicrobium yanjiei]MRJ99914.1 hypothetical protein [Aeromicrobium sp. S22]QGG40010.1 hypothetical protein GEV26_00675 [Aeromicrobium yanjiei]